MNNLDDRAWHVFCERGATMGHNPQMLVEAHAIFMRWKGIVADIHRKAQDTCSMIAPKKRP